MIHNYLKNYFIFKKNRETFVTLKLLLLVIIMCTASTLLWMRPQDSVARNKATTNLFGSVFEKKQCYRTVELSNSKEVPAVTWKLLHISELIRPNNQTLTILNSVEANEQKIRLPSRKKGKGKKRILLWTDFFFMTGADSFCIGTKGSRKQKEICDYECEFTTNRSALNSSHAVVFNERDLKTDPTRNFPLDMPEERLKSQYWIFLNLESPSHTFTNISSYENMFNWTMTYRSDSHVPIPYGLVKEHRQRITNSNYTKCVLQNIQKKTKLVAWIVSNSVYQPSKRTELVAELKKYVEIDIYGKSETLHCSKSNPSMCQELLSCYDEIGMDYKFYLAFENSLCEDYVTEKAFNALRTGMVPVVYGHVNYTKFLPPNSFINARDFPSPKELANYLIYLNKNTQEYLKYFEWTQSHMVVEDAFYLERAWCSLCERLHLDGSFHTVADLKNWWNFRNNSNVCVSSPFN